jgi:hypothetical protein
MLTNKHELYSFCLPAIRGWQANTIALRYGRKTMKLLTRDRGMKLSCLRSAGWKITFSFVPIREHSWTQFFFSQA